MTTTTTHEALMALPAGTVVRSAARTIGCRVDGERGVCFGDDRPFPWSDLALPVQVLYPVATVTPNPDDAESFETAYWAVHNALPLPWVTGSAIDANKVAGNIARAVLTALAALAGER